MYCEWDCCLAPGAQGFMGFQGSAQKGFQGPTGPQAPETQESGPQGTNGPQGMLFIGTRGMQGIQGNDALNERGFLGNQGAQGDVDLIGYQGDRGSQGPIGYQQDGSQGARGQQGTDGLAGTVGFVGPEGVGFQGVRGVLSQWQTAGATIGFRPSTYALTATTTRQQIPINLGFNGTLYAGSRYYFSIGFRIVVLSAEPVYIHILYPPTQVVPDGTYRFTQCNQDYQYVLVQQLIDINDPAYQNVYLYYSCNQGTAPFQISQINSVGSPVF